MVSYLTIDDGAKGQRIDNFLIAHCKRIPKARLYRAIRRGEVRVNKKRVKPDYRLKLDDDVRLPPFTFNAGPTTQKGIDRYKFLLNCIIYEDDHWILLNKPSGIPVHGGSFLHLGVIEALTQLRQDLRYLRLAHRLDRQTSGCLLLAKKRAPLIALQALMLKHRIEKRYLVLVKGNFKGQQKTVDLPLQKKHYSSGEHIVKVDTLGKPAKTIFIVKQRLENATLLEAKIITGRTHQIRAHAKAIGYPIAGDEKYGDRQFNKALKLLGLNRLFLHACSLSFKLQDKRFQFKSAIPLDLQRVMEKLRS